MLKFLRTLDALRPAGPALVVVLAEQVVTGLAEVSRRAVVALLAAPLSVGMLPVPAKVAGPSFPGLPAPNARQVLAGFQQLRASEYLNFQKRDHGAYLKQCLQRGWLPSPYSQRVVPVNPQRASANARLNVLRLK
jgi:hypothetical protein